MPWLQQAVNWPARKDLFRRPRDPQVLALYTATAGLGICALLVQDTIVTGYPHVQGGNVWTVRVREIVEWYDKLQAQVVGECEGQEISFFDVGYYRSRGEYQAGETRRFRVNALAYEVEVAPSSSVPATWESLAGLVRDEQTHDIDDFRLSGTIKESSNTHSLGVAVVACQVTPAVDLPLVWVYSARRNIQGAPSGGLLGLFGRGPSLAGQGLTATVWLQGYLTK
ncbi:MAG: hypothetical protein HY329_00520 [Chloroflexi bacterium]|nr:hypothetical protein [Chloroflexota bacterium]